MPPVHRTDAARLRQACAAMAIVFFVNGSVIGNWVPRIPAIKDRVGAGTGPLGLALLGIAVGALLSRQVAGQLVARFGSRSVVRLGLVAIGLALPTLALTRHVTTLGLLLIAFGAALGAEDVAINAHAVAVQERAGRPLMSFFHAVFSVGGLAGALIGGRASVWGVSPLLHFVLAAAVLGGLALVASFWLLPSDSDAAPKAALEGGWARLPRAQRLPLFLLGFVGACSMMGEGSCADWSAIYLRDNLRAAPGLAAWGYAAFSVSMAAGRFIGDRFVARWGGVRVITGSMTFAGCAFGLALLARHPAAAIGGFAALGVGLSVVIPVVFSTAGRMGGETAGPSITVVSSISGVGLFAGPPLIGYVAEIIGLPGALGLVSLLTLSAAGLIRVVNPPDFRIETPPLTERSPSCPL